MEIKCEQRSDEWYKLRTGMLTCSKFPKLMPTPKQKPGDWNETQLAILREVAAERLTGKREESYTSSAMQWGIDNEDMARYTFEAETMETVRTCGFYKSDADPEFIGGSPDGIIMRGDQDWGVLEVKCPTSKQHLKYLLDVYELWKDYGWQVCGQCEVTGLENYVLLSYDPRFPEKHQFAFVSGIYFDDMQIDLTDRLYAAIEMIKGWL